MFENEIVNHVKFGEGNVMYCDGSHIKVVFKCTNLEKTFAYPGVFDKFIRFQNGEAQHQAETELQKAKNNEKKIEAMKKLLQQENERRRLEAIKAKSVRRNKSR